MARVQKSLFSLPRILISYPQKDVKGATWPDNGLVKVGCYKLFSNFRQIWGGTKRFLADTASLWVLQLGKVAPTKTPLLHNYMEVPTFYTEAATSRTQGHLFLVAIWGYLITNVSLGVQGKRLRDREGNYPLTQRRIEGTSIQPGRKLLSSTWWMYQLLITFDANYLCTWGEIIKGCYSAYVEGGKTGF